MDKVFKPLIYISSGMYPFFKKSFWFYFPGDFVQVFNVPKMALGRLSSKRGTKEDSKFHPEGSVASEQVKLQMARASCQRQGLE